LGVNTTVLESAVAIAVGSTVTLGSQSAG